MDASHVAAWPSCTLRRRLFLLIFAGVTSGTLRSCIPAGGGAVAPGPAVAAAAHGALSGGRLVLTLEKRKPRIRSCASS